jgi:sulfite reductase alpha subunit-like flavoprotein
MRNTDSLPTSIDSIYFPWYEELRSNLLADYPLPASLSPIPDNVQLPPKYPLELLPAMEPSPAHDGDAGTPPLAEDDERRFLAMRTKNAALSHVDHPQSAAEQEEEHWKRLNVTFPADIARRDDIFERENPREFKALDKDNILNDHPEKYLLEPPPPYASGSPPDILLPIPDTSEAKLVRHNRVTPEDHWQDVRHLTFDVELEDKLYDQLSEYPGHLTLVMWPKNYQEDVEELLSLMGWESVADKSLKLHRFPRGLYSKTAGVTLRELLTHNLDITAVPKRSFIRDMIHFTQNENEKERLAEFVAPGNEQEFYDYTCRPRRTIIEVLRDFTGVKIPFNRVIDLFPFIRGREFSVCNGGTSLNEADGVNAVRIEILVALVEYKTIIRKPRQGLCSRYLKHLPVGTNLVVRLEPSSGPRLVPSLAWAKRPLIAIATGTGIAPIRAILQERDKYDHAGDTLLFFGCRNRTADFHFAREWHAFPSVRVYPAFSRDSIEPDPETTATLGSALPAADSLAAAAAALHPDAPQYDAHRNYVQHLIRKHADHVGSLMRRKPIVCICGNAGRMPISVRSALLDALVASKVAEDVEQAERWLGNPENVTLWQENW